MATYPYSSHHQAQALRHHITSLLCKACMLIGLSFPHIALAQTPGQLTGGARYDNCTVSKSGGKTTFKFRAQLVNGQNFVAQQNVPQTVFSTWGTIVFFYDADGNLKMTPAAVNVKMNNTPYQNSYAYPLYPTTPLFSGPYAYGSWTEFLSSWHKYVGGSNNFEIVVNSSDIAEYPGIAVAIAVHGTFLPGESIGQAWIDSNAVFLTEEPTTMCTQIITGTKPPAAQKVALTVKAPDWDFGELKANDMRDIVLSKEFCLEYASSNFDALKNEKLQMHVSNQNGMTGENPNMFKLVHTSDPNAAIPYNMHLLGTSITGVLYRMPNNQPLTLNSKLLNSGGQTCYSAYYATRTTAASKPGDYMDTLTFTVSNVP